MTRCWTGLGLCLGLLGTAVLSTNCYAGRQEQAASATSERDTDGSRTSDGKHGKPETSVQPAAPSEERENSVGLHLLKNIAEDQKALWVGPKSLRWVDADWLAPPGGAAAAVFVAGTPYNKDPFKSSNRFKDHNELLYY